MGLLRLPEILASLLARFWYINVYYEAAWTDSWCHRHCLHAHQTLIDAAKCAMPHGAARTNARKDARPVRRRESEDCEGGEKALGEGSGASEESGIVPSRGKPHVPFSHFVENP